MHLASCEPEGNRKSVSINGQMNFTGSTRSACADGFSIITGRTGAVLARLGVGAIDKEPFDIRIFY